MKSSILLPIAILSSFFLTDMNAYAAASPIPQTTSNQANNQWIEIGEVTMSGSSSKDPTATLYAYYIGNRILYKVDYRGKMYTVSKSDGYDYNAYIIVDGYPYYLNVPTW